MNYIDNFSPDQIDNQCKYLWGAILSLLYQKEENYEFLDQRIQSVINIVSGSNTLFHNSPKIITICSLLETARHDDSQFRKCIMDSMGLVDELRAEVSQDV